MRDAPERLPSPTSVIQCACWDGDQLKAQPGAEKTFEVPSAVPPSLARAYLRARVRSPLSKEVEVAVVLEGSTAVAHGSPTDWPSGMAQRVIAGELTLGTLRIRRLGSGSDAAPPADARPSGLAEKLALTLQVSAESISFDCQAISPSDASPHQLRQQQQQQQQRHVQLDIPSAQQPPRPRLLERTSSEMCLESAARLLTLSKLKVGVGTDRGGCPYMEDEHTVHAKPDFALYCVYDGHGGGGAAQFCRERLHFNVVASPSFVDGEPRAALLAGFRKTESDLLAEQHEALRTGEVVSECCGCTALVLLVLPDGLHVGWAGDCRAVLCRGGVAVPLTSDHGAGCATEAARVVAAGGEISDNRLGGFLEVTRALGDLDATTGSKPPGLSGEPELRSELTQAEDEFVVLGSDGLWGAIDSEEAVRIARAELQAYNDAEMASEKLVEVALKRHMEDNITAMVVCLRPVPPPPAPTQQRRRLVLTKPTGNAAVQPLGGVQALAIGEGQARLARLIPPRPVTPVPPTPASS